MQIKVLRETFTYSFEDLAIGEFFINAEDHDKDNIAIVYQKITDSEYKEALDGVGTYKNYKHNEPNRELYKIEFGLVEIKIVN